MNTAIVGSGVMGTGIAQLFSQCDQVTKVHWCYRNEKNLKVATGSLEKRWEAMRDKNRLTSKDIDGYKRKIVCECVSDLRNPLDVELLVYAVSEDFYQKNIGSEGI